MEPPQNLQRAYRLLALSFFICLVWFFGFPSERYMPGGEHALQIHDYVSTALSDVIPVKNTKLEFGTGLLKRSTPEEVAAQVRLRLLREPTPQEWTNALHADGTVAPAVRGDKQVVTGAMMTFPLGKIPFIAGSSPCSGCVVLLLISPKVVYIKHMRQETVDVKNVFDGSEESEFELEDYLHEIKQDICDNSEGLGSNPRGLIFRNGQCATSSVRAISTAVSEQLKAQLGNTAAPQLEDTVYLGGGGDFGDVSPKGRVMVQWVPPADGSGNGNGYLWVWREWFNTAIYTFVCTNGDCA